MRELKICYFEPFLFEIECICVQIRYLIVKRLFFSILDLLGPCLFFLSILIIPLFYLYLELFFGIYEFIRYIIRYIIMSVVISFEIIRKSFKLPDNELREALRKRSHKDKISKKRCHII